MIKGLVLRSYEEKWKKGHKGGMKLQPSATSKLSYSGSTV